MKTFVMGDLHGTYHALMQCLERSGFDYRNDCLIQLGDVADGFPYVYECVEELSKIDHLISLKGNHDDWFNEFIRTDYHPFFWNHGGKDTLISYLNHAGKSGKLFAKGNGYKTGLVAADIPLTHREFFGKQKLYHIDDHNRCFLHAGFKRLVPFFDQKKEDYYWDRALWLEAFQHEALQQPLEMATAFDEIYLGHTPTTNWQTDQPMKAFNIYNLDTGAGHSGRLTIMDIDSKAYWQSDPMAELYAQI
jgi:serine/threonine protein phosphatase 1